MTACPWEHPSHLRRLLSQASYGRVTESLNFGEIQASCMLPSVIGGDGRVLGRLSSRVNGLYQRSRR